MREPHLGAVLLLLTACSKPLPPLPIIDTDAFLPSIRVAIEGDLAAVRADPKDPERNGRLGMRLHAHDRFDAALVSYQRAQLLQPQEFRWLYLSGVVHASQSRDEEAAEAFRRALTRKPDDVPAQLRLAEALLASGKYAASRNTFERVIQLRPDNAIAYYGAGRAYALEGNVTRASELYQQACERYSSYGAARYALGLIYRQLGRAEESQKQLAMYERDKNDVPPREDPLMAAVHSLSGGILPLLAKAKTAAAAGRLGEAVELHRKALEVDPRQEQTHINLISLYGRLNEFDKAEDHYRSAVALNANRDELHYNYAVLLSVRGRRSEAIAAYRKTLELNPSHAEAHNNLGYLLAQQNKYDEALSHVTKALETKPDYPQAHFNAGIILLERARFRDAIGHLEAAARTNDSNAPRYLQALANAHARAGDHTRAREYAERARVAARAPQ